jgi:hypothetical protein
LARFSRIQNPPFFGDYEKYRPWLRLDFGHRCAYCERTEAYLRGEEMFEIDHFKPRRFTELVANYENLYYSCQKCNRYKSNTWPSDEEFSEGFRFSDPCAEDMYLAHFREAADGELEALTNCGKFTGDHIRLYRPTLVKWRQEKRIASEEIAKLETALAQLKDLADGETDFPRRELALQRVAVLERRIQRDREQFLS